MQAFLRGLAVCFAWRIHKITMHYLDRASEFFCCEIPTQPDPADVEKGVAPF